MFEKGDSSNKQWKWMVALFSKFYGKIWVGFCLKTGTRDFQNNPPFDQSACFNVTMSGNFERSKIFPKNLEYRF